MRSSLMNFFENIGWIVVLVIVLTVKVSVMPMWFQILLVIIAGFSIFATTVSLIKRFRR